MSGSFTLTGKLLHHDKITPLVSAGITILAGQTPDASDAVVYVTGAAKVTDANGAFSLPLLYEPSLYYTVVSDDGYFAPVTFAAPASGVLDLAAITTTNPGAVTPSVLTSAVAARDAAAVSATSAAASATAAGSSAGGGVLGRVRSNVTTTGTDQTTVLQGEIDALSGTAGGTRGGILLLPQGTILVSSIVLKDRVTLQGVGEEATILKTLTGSTATSLVTIPAGPVQQAYLQDLSIYGNGVTGQNGVYLKAVQSSALVGGWWYSGMRNVRVRYFDGVAIWLRAGTPGAGTPHQFLTFANVQAYSANTQPALRLSGQAGQIVFDDTCNFEGPAQANPGGMCVDIRREVNDDLTVASDTAPYSVVFDGTTLQNNETGLKVDRSSSVFWRDGHMETISQGVLAQTSAIVVVDRGTMSSVGTFAGAGYLFKVIGSSVIRVNNMVMNTTADKHFIATSGNIIATNCAVTDGSDPLTTTLTKQLHVDTVTVPGQLNLGFNRHAIVNTTTQQITSIVQAGAPGESIFIHALSGPLTFNTGGNIHASGLPMPYTVPKDTVVQLVKMDLGGAAWKFVTRAKYQETSTTAALNLATNGINTAGKYVGRMLWNTTTGRPVWATGAATTSTWVYGDGTTAHTPV